MYNVNEIIEQPGFLKCLYIVANDVDVVKAFEDYDALCEPCNVIHPSDKNEEIDSAFLRFIIYVNNVIYPAVRNVIPA